MSRKRILVDTSVLVAAFSPRDAQHVLCKEALLAVRGQAYTVDAVIVELAALLRRDELDVSAALAAISETKVLRVLPTRQTDYDVIATWMKKYADQSPDFADACIVHAAGREGIERVFTLDSDFLVYRTTSGRAFEVGPDIKRIRTRP